MNKYFIIVIKTQTIMSQKENILFSLLTNIYEHVINHLRKKKNVNTKVASSDKNNSTSFYFSFFYIFFHNYEKGELAIILMDCDSSLRLMRLSPTLK